MSKILRKFNGVDYQRSVSGYAFKKDAKKTAKAYRHWGVRARIIPAMVKLRGETRKKKIFYVYIPRSHVSWVNSNLVPELRM